MDRGKLDRIFYDKDKYIVLRNNVQENRCCFRPRYGDIITMIDRDYGDAYTDVFCDKNTSHNLQKLKLAGGIYILPTYNAFLPTISRRLFTDKISGNYVHVDYDGATHLVIEDVDYIYTLDIEHFVDIDVRGEGNIFLITYNILDNKHLIIVVKDTDYIEALNVVGDDIDVLDNAIVVTRAFSDSLGRIRRDIYVQDENRYRLVSSEFSYTYDIVTSKCTMADIEDAIYAHDYEYIRHHMDADTDIDTIREYVESILPREFDILRVEPLSSDRLLFVEDSDVGKALVTIDVTMDNGKIVNFARRDDGV